ncbi:MAG: serine/threonine protein kinase [Phycisphaeraceae bacterium]|nr:serine/threonine protein kinase [Phycisphaeraceae bacterium]
MDAASRPIPPDLHKAGHPSMEAEWDAPFAVPGNLGDEALADAIDRDVADRLIRGLPVSLDRYLPVIGEASRRPLAIDAAIDGALRAEAAAGTPMPRAVERLSANHPELRSTIESTATISMLFGPSGAAHEPLAPVAERSLPSRYGRPMPDGRGRYELVESLGSRKPARVFRAVDHLLSQPGAPMQVVVKILGRASDQAQLDEAIEEARLLRAIRHEAVVALVDSGVSDDAEVYLVTEFVHGASLREHVESTGKPEVLEAIRLVASLAHAVGIAHRAGVVHCDLSPSNLMVGSDGVVRIVDLGSASHAGAAAPFERVLRGTPGFMAPEQADPRREVDPALDVYALGAILFWLLTGVSANGRESSEIDALLRGRSDPAAWRMAVLGAAAVPRSVARLVMRAIDLDPTLRPRDAEAFAEELDQWLTDERRRRLPWRGRFGAWWRQHPRTAIAFTVLATALLTLSLVNTIMAPAPPPTRGAQYTLMAARSDRAIGYAMSRFDRSLRIDRDEARAMLARTPQILGTGRTVGPSLDAWMAGPEGARFASLLAGVQIIAARHGEATQIEPLVLRTTLAALLLSQGRDPAPVMRSGGADLETLLSPGDPLRAIAEAVRRGATARAVAEGMRGGRVRAGLPSPEVALVELDASIREHEAAERDVIVHLLRTQRALLTAAMAERSWRPAVSGEPTEAAAEPPRD